MDTLCRVCIDKATKCTSLNTELEDSSNLTFLDFLNKCTSLNARKNDNLPQSLCSTCTHSIKTFYSFVKLAEKSDIILRGVLKKSISGRYNHDNESSCEEIIIRDWEIEQRSEDSNKEGALKNYQTSKNSSESSRYILDIVKEEPQISEKTAIVDFKDGDINESHIFHSNLHHPEGNIEESDEILSCTDSDLASIDVDSSDSENCASRSLLKKIVKDRDVTDSQEIKIENKNHIRIEHGNRRQVSSEAKDDSLKSNILEHTENTYKCIECDKVFNDREQFRTHFRSHICGGEHECHICGKKFARHKNLRSHLVFHEENKKYKCSICEKTFKHFSSQWNHMRIHNGEKPYECEICGKNFRHRSGRGKHIVKMHSGENRFECETCGKRFCLKSKYDSHLQVHINIRYKCRHCGKVYKTKKYLLSHIDAQKYECEICNKIFCSKQYFKFHMEDHNIEKTATSKTKNLITAII